MTHKEEALDYFIENDFNSAANRFREEAWEYQKKGNQKKAVECWLWHFRFQILLGKYGDCIEKLTNLYEDYQLCFDTYLKALYHFMKANAHFYLGNKRETLFHAEAAVKEFKAFQSNDPIDLVNFSLALLIQGKAEWRRRDIAKAFCVFIEALGLILRAHNKNHYFIIGKTLNLIGAVLMDIGKEKEALAFLKLSDRFYKKFSDGLVDNHLYHGILYADFAYCYLKIGNSNQNLFDQYITESIDYKEKARSIFSDLYGNRSHRYLASILKIEARLLKERNAEWQEIIDILDRKITMRKEAFGCDKHPTIARAYNNQARACIREKKWKYGLGRAQLALISGIEAFNEKDNNFKNPSEEILKLEGIAETESLKALHNKAEIFLRQYEESKETNYLLHAYDSIKTAVQLIRIITRRLSSNESRLILIEQTRPIHEEAMELLYQVYQVGEVINKETGGLLTCEEVYSVVKYNKFLLLFVELSSRGYLEQAVRPTHGEEVRFGNLLDLLDEAETLMDRFLDQEEFQLEMLDAFTGEAESFFNNQRRQNQETDTKNLLDIERYEYSLFDIQEGIDGDKAAILSYFIGEKASYAILISRELFHVEKLHGSKRAVNELKKRAKDFRRIINREIYLHKQGKDHGVGKKAPNPFHNYINNAHQLYLELIHPLEKIAGFEKVDRMYIIPDNDLWYIPFEALLTEKQVDSPSGLNEVQVSDNGQKKRELRRYHQLPYLHFKYLLSYHFSEPLIYYLHHDQRQHNQEIRNIIFALGHTNDKEEKNFADSTLFRWSELWETHGIPGELGIHLQDRPVDDFFQCLKVFNAVLIHSHGGQDIDERPNLKIGPDNYVRIFDLRREGTFDWELLILHSCYSGAGPIRNGEGMIALNRIFIEQGVKNIIYTLFKIPTYETSELLSEFQKLLLQEKNNYTIVKALHEVKKQFSKDERYTPRDWAGLVFLGDQMRKIRG